MTVLLSMLIVFLGSYGLYGMQTNDAPDNNFISKRKMFYLSPEYRNENQILVTKALSSVLEYAGRNLLVVELIDGSEVPFYRSSGINSGLPDSWLPFFGLREDGWIHKNYTFNEEHNTHIPLNPLYHSGCYVLAQVGNELDRLSINTSSIFSIPSKRSDPSRNARGIATINHWIGGEMLEPSKMPQEIMLVLTKDLSPPIESGIDDFKEIFPETIQNNNKFGVFKNKSPFQTVINCNQYLLGFLENNPFTHPSFQSEMGNLHKFVYDLQTLVNRMRNIIERQNKYVADYEAFILLIKQSYALWKSSRSRELSDNLSAYLALQMLKRFSFNYVYKMLSDIAKASPSFELTEEVSSRAVWVMIKHNKNFGDDKKNGQIKAVLHSIRDKYLSHFQILCTEQPVQILRFMSGLSTEDTELEEDIESKEFLENIRKIVSEIYDSTDKEIYNIKRVITKGYHHQTFNQIVAYYSDENHFLGTEIPGINDGSSITDIRNSLNQAYQTISGANEDKFSKTLEVVQKVQDKLEMIVEIPKIFEDLKSIRFENFDNYITALNKIKYLKNIFQISSFNEKQREAVQISIEQITTILYMDALANIPGFKPLRS